MKISNLPAAPPAPHQKKKELKVMIIKMLEVLGRRMEEQNEKLEVFYIVGNIGAKQS